MQRFLIVLLIGVAVTGCDSKNEDFRDGYACNPYSVVYNSYDTPDSAVQVSCEIDIQQVWTPKNATDLSIDFAEAEFLITNTLISSPSIECQEIASAYEGTRDAKASRTGTNLLLLDLTPQKGFEYGNYRIIGGDFSLSLDPAHPEPQLIDYGRIANALSGSLDIPASRMTLQYKLKIVRGPPSYGTCGNPC